MHNLRMEIEFDSAKAASNLRNAVSVYE